MKKETDPLRKLRRDRRAALLGIFVGIVLNVAAPAVALYYGYWEHKFLSEGRESPQRIQKFRQTILEAEPTTENLRKIAEAVHKRLTEEADEKRDDTEIILAGFGVFTGCGMMLFSLSRMLKRYVALSGEHASREKSPDPPIE